jgi:hypothetical protein
LAGSPKAYGPFASDQDTVGRSAKVKAFSALGQIMDILRNSVATPGTSEASPRLVQRGFAKHLFSLAASLVVLATTTAAADPVSHNAIGPDEADLRVYLECSRSADTSLLAFDEAGICSRVFLRIKLSFVPGMTLDAFDQLSLEEKTAVNTLGYLRYLDWKAANATRLKDLQTRGQGRPPVISDGLVQGSKG